MSIFNEVQQLEELTVIGKALVKYAVSIEPGLVFQRQDGWWVPSIEKNFIGFQFRWSDMLSISLNLYGPPEEQFTQNDLILKQGRFNYSRCRITDETQLMAATVCIWRAHQLFHRERYVETGSLVLVDDMQTLREDRTRQPRTTSGAHAPLSSPVITDWNGETGGLTRVEDLADSPLGD